MQLGHIAQQINPKLKVDLKMANIKKSADEFAMQQVQISLLVAGAISAALFLGTINGLGLVMAFLILVFGFLIIFGLMFVVLLQSPKNEIVKRQRNLDKDVLFAGRFLLVKLHSGRPLFNSLIDASKSYGVASDYFKEIVDNINTGITIEKAVDDAIKFSPSEKFRKVLFKISNSLKIGVDVTNSLEATLEEIADEQLLEIQRYGKKLNSLAVFYMLVAIVMPSLGVAILFVVGTLVGMFNRDKMKIPYAEELGKAFVPKRWRPGLRKYLLVAGIDKKPYNFFGIMFYIAILTGIIVHFAFVIPFLTKTFDFLNPQYQSIQMLAWIKVSIVGFFTTIILFAILILTIILCIYFFLDIQIYTRTAELEAVLPDFFEIVSSNLKGGLSFERSLWLAIKPRFGILAIEIAIAAKKVMTGHDIDKALLEFSDKYDSPMLKRSMGLIISELKSGGEISGIIDKLTSDLKKTKQLKAEMSASVLSYIIFISAVVIVIAPLLFALSINLLEIIQRVVAMLMTSMSQTGGASGSPMGSMLGGDGGGSASIKKEDFVWFSHISIGIIGFFASMIIAIIEKGSIKAGLKYVPMFVISSQILFVICLQIMTAVFGSMISF